MEELWPLAGRAAVPQRMGCEWEGPGPHGSCPTSLPTAYNHSVRPSEAWAHAVCSLIMMGRGADPSFQETVTVKAKMT